MIRDLYITIIFMGKVNIFLELKGYYFKNFSKFLIQQFFVNLKIKFRIFSIKKKILYDNLFAIKRF